MSAPRSRWHWVDVLTNLLVISFPGRCDPPADEPPVMREFRDVGEDWALRKLTAEAWEGPMGEIGPKRLRTMGGSIENQCPSCLQSHAVMTADAAFRQLPISYMNLPLGAIHPHAHNAALASSCAGEQGARAGMHHALFETQPWQGEYAPFPEAAVAAGVPGLDELRACFSSTRARTRLDEDIAVAAQLKVNAIPTVLTPLGRHSGEMSPSALLTLLAR